MNQDEEPEHIGRKSWLQRRHADFLRPMDVVDELTCASEVRRIVFLLGEASSAAPTFAAAPNLAPVAQLTSLSDDTPPSSMGLDGVFYVYEP